MPTNFELKRLKPKLDIVKKPENRVHELTDSNVSLREDFSFLHVVVLSYPTVTHKIDSKPCQYPRRVALLKYLRIGYVR